MTALVLASRSRSRAAMLRAAGLDIAVTAADVDERALDTAWSRAGHGPAEIARRLAEEKAQTVSRGRPGTAVIGADQTLELAGRRLSKPGSVDEARSQLQALRGRTHHLHSGVALVREGRTVFSGVASAAMHVRSFSAPFLEGYLQAMGPRLLDSVGCYEFEGLGAQLFERAEGDYFTILGMPLLPLLAALRKEGLIPS